MMSCRSILTCKVDLLPSSMQCFGELQDKRLDLRFYAAIVGLTGCRLWRQPRVFKIPVLM